MMAMDGFQSSAVCVLADEMTALRGKDHGFGLPLGIRSRIISCS